MIDAFEGFTATIAVGGRQITHLRFVDDIDLIAGTRGEHADLTSRIYLTARRCGMEISSAKCNSMVTNKVQ